MASPIPYGLHVISGELTDKDNELIISTVHRFLVYKETARLKDLKQVYDFPDGGYFIIQHVGGLFRVIVDKLVGEKVDRFKNDGLVKAFIPMFFSGVIERASIRNAEKVQIKITEQCRKRLSNQLNREVSKTIELDRFTIMPNPKFSEFISKDESVIKKTQYANQNPSLYSGSLAKAMQFVGGYGRHDINNLPENDLERVNFSIPEELRKALIEDYFDIRLPGYKGVPPESGQFQYDYKWGNTCAISFDDKNNPWLVKVSASVYVMPLPIIPLTADSRFHDYIYEIGDTELINIIETFGAFPSGESFPDNPEDFQRWLRAGVIIKICDSADFFSHIPFFEACGWSFNTKGNNAYNTGYRYDNSGIIESSTFKLSLNLTSSDKHYGINTVQINEQNNLNEKDRIALIGYLSKIMAAIGEEGSLSKTIKYKLRNIETNKVLERVGNNIGNAWVKSEIDYWDKYVCEPIAAHTGKINKLYTGKLYHHAKPNAQPQIKFPNYQLGFCVSFDFTPSEKGVSAECDTIIYAYYDDDSIKVVKYFYTLQRYEKNVETDYEEYMTVGSWYKNESLGGNTISGHFYLTDLDDREDISPTEIRTTIKGEDRGYDSKPNFSFDAFFHRPGTLWRNRYYTHETKSETTRDKYIDISILIPMFNRSTVLHARKSNSGNTIKSEMLELKSIRDPYTYRYWTYDFVFAWVGGLEKMTGSPSPKNGSPVWVEIENYNPDESNDFANNGPWIVGLPQDYTWLIHPDNNTWQHSGGGGAPTVNQYSKSTASPVIVSGEVKWAVNDKIVIASNKAPDNRYFLPSPDEYGFSMSRSSCKVLLGDIDYSNISEIEEQGYWKYTGYTSLVNHSRLYHFIGVINE